MKELSPIKLLLVIFADVHLKKVSCCEMYNFSPANDVVLEGHVIKTITRAQVNLCWGECVWMPWCFSINVRKTIEEIFECVLNNSSKKANPTKMVARKGWTYQEMKVVDSAINCKIYDCRMKEDLGNGWYLYGDAAIKLFKEKKNWNDARSHCQSIGGDLLSITSSHEKDFINEVFVSQLNLTYIRQDQPDVGIPYIHWKLNGDEPSIKFGGPSGAVKYVYDDQETALFFKASIGGYATLPSLPLNPEGFSAAFWAKVNPDNITRFQNMLHIFTRDGDYQKILVYFNSQKLSHTLKINREYIGTLRFKYNIWTHIGLSWNKTTGLITYIVLGNKPLVKSVNLPPFSISTNDEFWLGSYSPFKKKPDYHGFIKHLVLFNASLDVEKLQTFSYWNYHGVWIGLHNEGHTTNYKWSDGTNVMEDLPVPRGFQLYPTTVKKCFITGKNGKWVGKKCEMEYPFICERKLS